MLRSRIRSLRHAGSRRAAAGKHARHAPRLIGLAILALALFAIAIGIATGT
jgi:hypothetical protein